MQFHNNFLKDIFLVHEFLVHIQNHINQMFRLYQLFSHYLEASSRNRDHPFNRGKTVACLDYIPYKYVREVAANVRGNYFRE